jgi:ubiquinone/menaquinone biosynthesis C-methylase UbiE
MADRLGMDPARIERLRSAERLAYFDPDRIWDTVDPDPRSTLVDIGTGVGFVALPFARRYPDATVHACDVLEGMVQLLAEDARTQGLGNIEAMVMAPNSIDLPDRCADLIVMAQLHHELDSPQLLLSECRRLLAVGGTVVIVDWKDVDNDKGPPADQSVPESTIRSQLQTAGFSNVHTHNVFRYHTFLTAAV